MRIARGSAVALTVMLTAALAVGTAAGSPGAAVAAVPRPAPGAVRWSPVLADGDAVRVEVTRDGVRATPFRQAPDAASPDGPTDPRPPGLLTLPARRMDVPVDRVEVTVEVAAGPAEAVDVDVRGLRVGGGWTEWAPASATRASTPTPTLQVALPAPAIQVQARLVLTPTTPMPEVGGLHLAAYAAPPSVQVQSRAQAQRYRVFATREGLVGGTTANGHVITDRDLFVALPSRRALAPRDKSDYSVKVCASTGRCAFAPVWDVGPWNTRDDYWNPSNRRQSWDELPRGMPEAQAAKTQGYNGGKDQFGRVVRNPAGIDLADGLFWDALGLKNNDWVTVDYLWTGDSPLATLPLKGRTALRGAPDPAARIVGLVAGGAAVPLQCVTGTWLRIGAGQFLPVAAVPRAQWPRHLPRCGRK